MKRNNLSSGLYDSEFRKRRIEENRKRKALKQSFSCFLPCESGKIEPIVISRSIAIMLDLEGTCNKIKDEEAKIFLKQVDAIRKQFGNQKAYICISTHSSSTKEIKRVYDILNNYKSDDIILDTSFVFGGVYDYKYDSVTPMGFCFNANKVQTFIDYYLNNSSLNIGWFAVIDDRLSEDFYKSYQRFIPMVGLKPSGKKDEYYNNFMYRTTDTDNFLGVIDLMERYINDIKGMTLFDILDEQEEMQRHLSSWDLHELIRNCQFGSIIEYLNSGMADEFDFKDTYVTLMLFYQEGLGKQYDDYITELLKILDENSALDRTVEDVRKLIFSNEGMK